ncbi:MAG TPA: tryptophan 7-halogenase [Verrucomicrobiae bacterium]|nr:tryptophan 7-halogenase [Verrucomicrobiae bacterium]
MDDRPVDADVLVVGGGPAGAAAAIACAVRGHRVVLCEREGARRERPGETLHPGVEPLLAQLGVADRLTPVVGARHAGIWIEWGGPRRFEAFGSDATGPWSGFQVWRADFDALLLTRAGEVGVDVRQPCAVTGPPIADGPIRSVPTTAGPIAARVIVDATGMTRWLGRALGVRSPVRSPRLIARYGYLTGSCPARDEAPALVGDSTGWTWTALVRPRTYQWTRVSFGQRPDVDWIPEEFRYLTPLMPSRGADVTWRMAAQAAGPGWFMVGDAAAALDPTSSHGVLKALVSGIAAGHLISAVLGGKAPAEATAEAYHQWLAGWFSEDAAKLTQFYRRLGASAFAAPAPQKGLAAGGAIG